MNLKDLLKKKAEYSVRLICNRDLKANNYDERLNAEKGDEIGIEVIDFSIGNIRCCNKNTLTTFELYYDKNTWLLEGDWHFKNI
jgi:hypothetical protein